MASNPVYVWSDGKLHCLEGRMDDMQYYVKFMGWTKEEWASFEKKKLPHGATGSAARSEREGSRFDS